ncbi:MAG TPA: class III signal peptide-containing protein [Candidatus Norongarragalinales archaeon]|nr:class III signal peptide-containing protein [Candidatus Norongarragalinales archaeon]
MISKRGQTALEYLLLVAGAVAFITILIFIVKSRVFGA